MENKCFPPYLHLCFLYLFVKCQKRSLILIYYDLKSDAWHRNGHLTMILWLCSISKIKYVFCSEQHQMPCTFLRTVWRYPRVIRIRKSKARQHTGHKKKDKRTNNDLQTGEPLFFIYLLISLRKSPQCHCHTLQHAN